MFRGDAVNSNQTVHDFYRNILTNQEYGDQILQKMGYSGYTILRNYPETPCYWRKGHKPVSFENIHRPDGLWDVVWFIGPHGSHIDDETTLPIVHEIKTKKLINYDDLFKYKNYRVKLWKRMIKPLRNTPFYFWAFENTLNTLKTDETYDSKYLNLIPLESLNIYVNDALEQLNLFFENQIKSK